MYIHNAKIDLIVNHIFCKFEDIDDELITKLGKGVMKHNKHSIVTGYMVYKYKDYVIFPE